MGSMEVPGERAAEHPQGVRRRRKRQSRQRRTQGSGPYGCSIDRKADEEKGIQADSMTRPATAEREIRQVKNHQPPFDYAAGKSFLASASHSGAPPRRSPVLLFLFWTVHGPFSLFLLARKRENGGCKEPAIFMAVSSPPVRVRTNSPPRRCSTCKPPSSAPV